MVETHAACGSQNCSICERPPTPAAYCAPASTRRQLPLSLAVNGGWDDGLALSMAKRRAHRLEVSMAKCFPSASSLARCTVRAVLAAMVLSLTPRLAFADPASGGDEAAVAHAAGVLIGNDVQTWLSNGRPMIDWDKIEGAVAKTDAPHYWREHDENEAGFDQKYVGGNVGISGRVYSVRSGKAGWVIDLVSSPSGIDDVEAELDPREVSYAASLRRGNEIGLVCKAPSASLRLSGCLSIKNFISLLATEAQDQTADFLAGKPPDGILLDPKVRHSLIIIGWALSHGYDVTAGKQVVVAIKRDPRLLTFERKHPT